MVVVIENDVVEGNVVVSVVLGAGVHHRSVRVVAVVMSVKVLSSFAFEGVVLVVNGGVVVSGIGVAVVLMSGAGVHHMSCCVVVVGMVMSIEVSSSLLLNTASRACAHVGRSGGLLYAALIEVVDLYVVLSRELSVPLVLLNTTSWVTSDDGGVVVEVEHICYDR